MFNIETVPTFRETIKVGVPGGEEETFGATYEALDIDEFTGFDLNTADGSKAFLTRVVLSVDDVIDAMDNPVPSSPELIGKLLNKSWVRQPLVAAYFAGLTKARVGN